MKTALKVLSLALIFAMSSGCVTTQSGPYDDKKDLGKAEQQYIKIGYGYFQQDQLLKSKNALTKAIEINPNSAGAHLGLARVYERELEFDLADKHFNEALKYGDDVESNFQYGVYLYNRGQYQASYDQMDIVLQDTLYVRRSLAFEMKAIVSNRLGKTEEAITSYEKAIVLNPSMARSYLGLTRIYFTEQDYRRAYRSYNGFVRLVRAKMARQSASSLWLGIQLAHYQDDPDAYASFTLQLRNQFSESKEYERFVAWKATEGLS